MIIEISIVLTALFAAWCIGSVMDILFNKINDKFLATIIPTSTVVLCVASAHNASAQNISVENTSTKNPSAQSKPKAISTQKETTEKPLKLKLSTSGVGDWSFGTLNFLVPDNSQEQCNQTNLNKSVDQ